MSKEIRKQFLNNISHDNIIIQSLKDLYHSTRMVSDDKTIAIHFHLIDQFKNCFVDLFGEDNEQLIETIQQYINNRKATAFKIACHEEANAASKNNDMATADMFMNMVDNASSLIFNDEAIKKADQHGYFTKNMDFRNSKDVKGNFFLVQCQEASIIGEDQVKYYTSIDLHLSDGMYSSLEHVRFFECDLNDFNNHQKIFNKIIAEKSCDDEYEQTYPFSPF